MTPEQFGGLNTHFKTTAQISRSVVWTQHDTKPDEQHWLLSISGSNAPSVISYIKGWKRQQVWVLKWRRRCDLILSWESSPEGSQDQPSTRTSANFGGFAMKTAASFTFLSASREWMRDTGSFRLLGRLWHHVERSLLCALENLACPPACQREATLLLFVAVARVWDQPGCQCQHWLFSFPLFIRFHWILMNIRP